MKTQAKHRDDKSEMTSGDRNCKPKTQVAQLFPDTARHRDAPLAETGKRYTMIFDGITRTDELMRAIMAFRPSAVGLAFYLLSNPERTGVPGLTHMSTIALREQFGNYAPRTFNGDLGFLIEIGFVEHDSRRDLLFVPRALAGLCAVPNRNNQTTYLHREARRVLKDSPLLHRVIALLPPLKERAAGAGLQAPVQLKSHYATRQTPRVNQQIGPDVHNSAQSLEQCPPLERVEEEEEKKKTAAAASRIGQPPLAGTVGELLPCLLSSLPHPVEQPAATQSETIAAKGPDWNYRDPMVRRVMNQAALPCRLSEAKEGELQDLLAQPAVASGIASGRIKLDEICLAARRSLSGTLTHQPAHFYAGEVKRGVAAAARTPHRAPGAPATQRSWGGGPPSMGRDFPVAQEASQPKSALPDFTGLTPPPLSEADKAATAAGIASLKLVLGM